MAQLPRLLQKEVHFTVAVRSILKLFIRSSVSSLTFYLFALSVTEKEVLNSPK